MTPFAPIALLLTAVLAFAAGHEIGRRGRARKIAKLRAERMQWN